MSSVDIPFATRLTTSETVIRTPRMQARPPITAGSNVMRSNIPLIYQPEEQSESQCEPAGPRIRSSIRTSEVKNVVTSELANRNPAWITPDKHATGLGQTE